MVVGSNITGIKTIHDTMQGMCKCFYIIILCMDMYVLYRVFDKVVWHAIGSCWSSVAQQTGKSTVIVLTMLISNNS